MDVPTLSAFLSSILNAASVWNTGETGDIHCVLCIHCEIKTIEGYVSGQWYQIKKYVSKFFWPQIFTFSFSLIRFALCMSAPIKR